MSRAFHLGNFSLSAAEPTNNSHHRNHRRTNRSYSSCRTCDDKLPQDGNRRKRNMFPLIGEFGMDRVIPGLQLPEKESLKENKLEELRKR